MPVLQARSREQLRFVVGLNLGAAQAITVFLHDMRDTLGV